MSVQGFHYLLTWRKCNRYKKLCPNLPQWCPNLPHVPNYPVPPYLTLAWWDPFLSPLDNLSLTIFTILSIHSKQKTLTHCWFNRLIYPCSECDAILSKTTVCHHTPEEIWQPLTMEDIRWIIFVIRSRIVQKTNKARLVTDCVPWKIMTSLIIWYRLAEWEVLEKMHVCGSIQYFSSAYGSLKRWLHWLSDDSGHSQSGDAVGDKLRTLEVYT